MTLLALFVVLVVSPYLSFDPDVYFPEQRETYLRLEFALGVHVLSGILALLVGPFQFVGGIRRRFVRVHRVHGGRLRRQRDRPRAVRPGPGADGVHRPGRGRRASRC